MEARSLVGRAARRARAGDPALAARRGRLRRDAVRVPRGRRGPARPAALRARPRRRGRRGGPGSSSGPSPSPPSSAARGPGRLSDTYGRRPVVVVGAPRGWRSRERCSTSRPASAACSSRVSSSARVRASSSPAPRPGSSTLAPEDRRGAGRSGSYGLSIWGGPERRPGHRGGSCCRSAATTAVLGPSRSPGRWREPPSRARQTASAADDRASAARGAPDPARDPSARAWRWPSPTSATRRWPPSSPCAWGSHGAAVFVAFATSVVATRLPARAPPRTASGRAVTAVAAGCAEAGPGWRSSRSLDRLGPGARRRAVVMGWGFSLLYPALAPRRGRARSARARPRLGAGRVHRVLRRWRGPRRAAGRRDRGARGLRRGVLGGPRASRPLLGGHRLAGHLWSMIAMAHHDGDRDEAGRARRRARCRPRPRVARCSRRSCAGPARSR